MNKISLDEIYFITSKLDAKSLIKFSQINTIIYHYKNWWISSLMRTYWIILFKDDKCFIEKKSNIYNLVDLLRLECWIKSPLGNCVSCFRNIPLKLGNFCIECVGNKQNFILGSSHNRILTKCSNSHSDMIFTCFICEMSMCYNCLFMDKGCNFCRLISEELD